MSAKCIQKVLQETTAVLTVVAEHPLLVALDFDHVRHTTGNKGTMVDVVRPPGGEITHKYRTHRCQRVVYVLHTSQLIIVLYAAAKVKSLMGLGTRDKNVKEEIALFWIEICRLTRAQEECEHDPSACAAKQHRKRKKTYSIHLINLDSTSKFSSTFYTRADSRRTKHRFSLKIESSLFSSTSEAGKNEECIHSKTTKGMRVTDISRSKF